jgi:hypothetical protein
MNTSILLGAIGLAGTVVVLGQINGGAVAGETAGTPDVPRAGTGATFIATGGAEPDVTTSRLGLTSGGSGSDDFHYYGTADGIRAFSMASTSCNVGDRVAEWISGSQGRHPVIGQNVFRYLDGKFEHIGQSWLKHSFCAVSEFTCGACQTTGCDTLGIGCADTYWATLNDGASGGPKSEINPEGYSTSGSSATHTHPYSSPSGPGAIRGRLQLHESDILAGGQFVAEVQYVTHDEILKNRTNNASWRPINVSLTNMWGVGSGQSSVRFQESGIMAWKEWDPGVAIVPVTLDDEGHFNVGYRVTDNLDGTWHYEYAVHNLMSDRGARGWSIPLPPGVNVTNIGFHDVDYHSGEPYDLTDWLGVEGDGVVAWETDPYAENINANAIRWGTLYNFRFDADAPPASGNATMAMFKPGTQMEVDVPVQVPSAPACIADLDDDGEVGFTDLTQLLAAWGPCPGCPEDIDGNGEVGFPDLTQLLAAWGPCP